MSPSNLWIFCVNLVLLIDIRFVCGFTDCDCGQAGVQRRVFGGNETSENQYPWVVHLRFYDYPGSTQFGLCGGSLIDHQHIVTAAHCVHDARGNTRDVEAVQAFLGAHNLLLLPRARAVERFILPKHYDFKKPVHNDFAILRLRKPVKFSRKISPICIPKSDYEPYDKLTVAGWGHLGPRQRTATVLQHVDVYHVDTDKCFGMVKNYILKNYPSVRRNPEKYKIPPIHEHHMCAVDGRTGGDACQGDSGGPLMYLNPNNNRFYLIGIVSGAYDQCGDKETPGFYTIVKDFRQMIRHLVPASYVCDY